MTFDKATENKLCTACKNILAGIDLAENKRLLDEALRNGGKSEDITAVSCIQLPSSGDTVELMNSDGTLKDGLREKGIAALKKYPAAFVMLSGGAGTRYTDSAKNLKKALDEGTMTDEQSQTVAAFRKLSMNVDKCLSTGKLFAPISCIREKGPFELNLEAVAEVISACKIDLPVVVFTGGTTRDDVLSLLKKNENFGIRHIAVCDQDELPFVREDDYTFMQRNGANATGANGGGGIIYSLGSAKPVSPDGKMLFDGSVSEWLTNMNIENVIFSQTDDAKRSDIYAALAGVSENGNNEMVFTQLCGHYPTATTNGKPDFKLGSIWTNGEGAFACCEFAELKAEQVAQLTSGAAVSNTGMYLMSLSLINEVIERGLLKIHCQHHKKEDGSPVTKFEYFLPDMLAVASHENAKCRIAMLRSTEHLDAPLTNLTVDSLPAKDIGKLALAQLAKLLCDKALLNANGITIEDGALVEIAPFADLTKYRGTIVRNGEKKLFD